jgi:hypothetical protein
MGCKSPDSTPPPHVSEAEHQKLLKWFWENYGDVNLTNKLNEN